jgi:hypothetical protein
MKLWARLKTFENLLALMYLVVGGFGLRFIRQMPS